METHMMRVERPDEANDLFVLIEAESYPDALLIRDYIEDGREDKVDEISLHVRGAWDCFPTKAQQALSPADR